jgi:hypothetical protein
MPPVISARSRVYSRFTDRYPQSTRPSVGGSLTKKHGLIVTSEKVGEKRVYSIKA